MVIYIINSRTRKVKHFDIAMFLKFLFVGAINHRITNYCTSTRRPMKFFVGFWCFLYVFFLACGSLNYFLFSLLWLFSEDNDLQLVFRRNSWCFSYLIIFIWSSMSMFEISVSTVFTFLDSTIESSGLLVLHVDSPSLVSWVTSKSHVSPTILQLLFWRISLLRSFLIISFLVEISDLRNSISLSRLVISFLSTTVWYSSWLCKLVFCFTSFCIKSLISFFISGRRTSLSFLYFAYLYALSITSSVSNELLLSFSVSLETKELIWSSMLGDRMLLLECGVQNLLCSCH